MHPWLGITALFHSCHSLCDLTARSFSFFYSSTPEWHISTMNANTLTNTHLHTKALSNSLHSPALVLQICLASRSQTTLPSLAPSPMVQRARQHFNLTHALQGHQRSQAFWSGDLLTNNVLIVVLCMC